MPCRFIIKYSEEKRLVCKVVCARYQNISTFYLVLLTAHVRLREKKGKFNDIFYKEST